VSPGKEWAPFPVDHAVFDATSDSHQRAVTLARAGRTDKVPQRSTQPEVRSCARLLYRAGSRAVVKDGRLTDVGRLDKYTKAVVYTTCIPRERGRQREAVGWQTSTIAP
jgi:hypothetical protein